MKKLFLLLIVCCLSLTMSARVAYLVPGNSNDKSVIPAQWDNHTFEHTAYDWFKTTYVDAEVGDFINFTNIPTNADEYAAIWIYIDREWLRTGDGPDDHTPFNEEKFDALFTNDVVNALKTYVQNGGNLFLGKQAARLAYRMGRIEYAPNYQCGGYSQDDRFWGIKAKLGSGLSTENQRNRSNHPIYAGLATATMDGVEGCFPLLNATGDAHSTDNNIHWVEYWTPNGEGGWRKNPNNNGDPALIDGWESYWNAKALGTWTSIGDYCIIQAVEFMPKDAFKGTILTINIGAYQWNSESTGDAADNMRKLTKNALRHLNKPTRKDVHIDEDLPNNGRDKYNSELFMELYGDIRGLVPEFVPNFEGIEEEQRAEVEKWQDDEHMRLAFTKAGKVNLVINLKENRTDHFWPAGDYTFTQNITFAFDKTEPTREDLHIDDDFYANGREGGVATGDFMVLHPELRGTSATYTVTNGTGEAEVAEGLRGRNRLAFTKAGTVTLRVSAQQVKKITKWPCGTYNFDKEITFAFDKDINVVVNDLSSNGLDGETGKFMVLHKNMQGLDATYETSFEGIEEAARAEVATIVDDDFNRLTFTKPGTVKLLVSLKYSDEHNTVIGKGVHVATKTVTFAQPAFSWTHEPDHAVVGEGKPAAQATCNVPGATVKYESSDPTIASIDETSGQITYLHSGTCNITAFVQISGVKYSSAPFALNVGSLVYSRANVSSTFSTICLSREATAVSGVKKIYTLTGVKKENGTITNIVMDELEGSTMTAGTPYVIRTEGTEEAPVTITFHQEGVEADVQPANGLMGTLSDITIDANTNGHSGSIYYLATDGKLHRVSGTATVNIGANKAYFDLDGVDAPSAPSAPGRMFMAIDGAQPLPTALDGTIEGENGTKMIRNGQLIIRRGESYYDVVGNRIK